MKRVLGILILLLLFWFCFVVSGQSYYVDKDSIGGTCNNDYSNSQNNINHPWCTIGKATKTMTNGDTVIVRSAIYNEQIYFQKSNIVLKGYGGELPVIDGNFNLPSGIYGDVSQLVQINKQGGNYQNITFENFEVRKSYGSGIGVSGTKGVVLRNLLVYGIMETGVNTKNCSDILIENVTLYNANERHIGGADRPWGNGILSISSTDVIIRNSKVFNNSGEGIGIVGVNNAIVENNIVYDSRSAGIYSNWGENVTIRNNLVYATRASKFFRGHGTTGSLIAVSNEAPEHTPSAERFLSYGYGNNIKIYNNLVVGGIIGISMGGEYTISENISVYNNIVIEAISNDNTHVNFKIGNRLKNVEVRNNIFIQKDGRISAVDSPATFSNNFWSKDPVEAYVDYDSIVGGTLTFTGNIDWKNIKQEGLSPDNFIFKETSLVVDKGVAVGINYDYFGVARINKPDIGAIEYSGAAPLVVFENCNNLIDDDLDGLVDCKDSDCPACVVVVISPVNESCGNMLMLYRFNDGGVFGKFGNARNFDGVDDVVAVDEINLTRKSFTISAWVRPNINPPSNQVYFSAHNNSSLQKSLVLRFYDTGKIRFGFYANDLDTATGIVQFGQWNHVVASYDSINDVSKIYVNGTLVASGGQGPFVGDNANVAIGAWMVGDGLQFFNGAIDEVVVWNRTLSDLEISKLGLSSVNCDNVSGVSLGDIFSQIAEWKSGRVSLSEVFVVIRAWGEGGWL